LTQVIDYQLITVNRNLKLSPMIVYVVNVANICFVQNV